MSLVAVVRSVIGETEDSSLLTEQYIVELVDDDLPCPYLGGIGGVRVVEDTDIDRNNHIAFSRWSYNFETIFDVTPKGGQPKSGTVLAELNKHAKTLWDTDGVGDLYENLKDYFVGQDAPFQTSGVKYHISEKEDAIVFRQMLNRKFGQKVQLEIEAVLGDILNRNERSNFFGTTKENVTSERSARFVNYPDWGHVFLTTKVATRNATFPPFYSHNYLSTEKVTHHGH